MYIRKRRKERPTFPNQETIFKKKKKKKNYLNDLLDLKFKKLITVNECEICLQAEATIRFQLSSWRGMVINVRL